MQERERTKIETIIHLVSSLKGTRPREAKTERVREKSRSSQNEEDGEQSEPSCLTEEDEKKPLGRKERFHSSTSQR